MARAGAEGAAAAGARGRPADAATRSCSPPRPCPKLGFVLASFNLDAVGLSLRDSYGGPRGLEFLLADASGETVLTRSIQPERWIGKPLQGTPFGPERDVDGKARLYATRPSPGVGWRVHAGADRAQALAATRAAQPPRG